MFTPFNTQTHNIRCFGEAPELNLQNLIKNIANLPITSQSELLEIVSWNTAFVGFVFVVYAADFRIDLSH